MLENPGDPATDVSLVGLPNTQPESENVAASDNEPPTKQEEEAELGDLKVPTSAQLCSNVS